MADEQSRKTVWRQGMVLDHQVALALCRIPVEDAEQRVAVVVTHDCDIANSSEREPFVEVIVGGRMPALGADTHAKTARRLHIEFQTGEGPVAVELVATDKMQLPKEEVLATAPRENWLLRPEGVVTLQQWLAARYRRSAFADEFERRLKSKPARLDKKIAKALVAPSEHILAVFFDVDAGEEKQCNGLEDVYQLHITLLYDSTKDDPTAYEAAEKAASAIEDAFEKEFFQGGTWKSIQLLSCTAVSDSVMTVAESRLLKQWWLDYMSLDEGHQQSMLA
ncbi:MAG: hypothetical protein JWQ23_3738 [Herminiimonas sp.]|nr:hypothetical protein [Herminiimonas sp.]